MVCEEMTLKDFASRIGLSTTTCSRYLYEKNTVNIRYDRCYDISHNLFLKPDFLFMHDLSETELYMERQHRELFKFFLLHEEEFLNEYSNLIPYDRKQDIFINKLSFNLQKLFRSCNSSPHIVKITLKEFSEIFNMEGKFSEFSLIYNGKRIPSFETAYKIKESFESVIKRNISTSDLIVEYPFTDYDNDYCDIFAMIIKVQHHAKSSSKSELEAFFDLITDSDRLKSTIGQLNGYILSKIKNKNFIPVVLDDNCIATHIIPDGIDDDTCSFIEQLKKLYKENKSIYELYKTITAKTDPAIIKWEEEIDDSSLIPLINDLLNPVDSEDATDAHEIDSIREVYEIMFCGKDYREKDWKEYIPFLEFTGSTSNSFGSWRISSHESLIDTVNDLEILMNEIYTCLEKKNVSADRLRPILEKSIYKIQDIKVQIRNK